MNEPIDVDLRTPSEVLADLVGPISTRKDRIRIIEQWLNRRAPSAAFVAMQEALEMTLYRGAWTVVQEGEWDRAREKALALAESETSETK